MQELSNIWRLLNDQLWAVEWDRIKPRSFLCYGIPCFPRLRRYVLLQATHALPSPSLGSHPDNSSVRQALQGYETRLGDGPCASLQSIALVQCLQESFLVHRTFWSNFAQCCLIPDHHVKRFFPRRLTETKATKSPHLQSWTSTNKSRRHFLSVSLRCWEANGSTIFRTCSVLRHVAVEVMSGWRISLT
jgi:hypothetical protein